MSKIVGLALAPCRDRRSFSNYAAWRKRQPYIENMGLLDSHLDNGSRI
jgi:hypothetical protein